MVKCTLPSGQSEPAAQVGATEVSPLTVLLSAGSGGFGTLALSLEKHCRVFECHVQLMQPLREEQCEQQLAAVAVVVVSICETPMIFPGKR